MRKPNWAGSVPSISFTLSINLVSISWPKPFKPSGRSTPFSRVGQIAMLASDMNLAQ